MKTMSNSALTILLVSLLAACSDSPGDPEAASVNAQWLHHGGDHFSSKYAPFDQINGSNFEQLEVTWRWQSADLRIPEDLLYPTGDYRATPLYIDGIMYTNTNHGQVVALDPASGEELWVFDPESYRLGPPNFSPVQTRGIEYWTDGEVERIFLATLGKQLVSIDITTGEPDRD